MVVDRIKLTVSSSFEGIIPVMNFIRFVRTLTIVSIFIRLILVVELFNVNVLVVNSTAPGLNYFGAIRGFILFLLFLLVDLILCTAAALYIMFADMNHEHDVRLARHVRVALERDLHPVLDALIVPDAFTVQSGRITKEKKDFVKKKKEKVVSPIKKIPTLLGLQVDQDSPDWVSLDPSLLYGGQTRYKGHKLPVWMIKLKLEAADNILYSMIACNQKFFRSPQDRQEFVEKQRQMKVILEDKTRKYDSVMRNYLLSLSQDEENMFAPVKARVDIYPWIGTIKDSHFVIKDVDQDKIKSEKNPNGKFLIDYNEPGPLCEFFETEPRKSKLLTPQRIKCICRSYADKLRVAQEETKAKGQKPLTKYLDLDKYIKDWMKLPNIGAKQITEKDQRDLDWCVGYVSIQLVFTHGKSSELRKHFYEALSDFRTKIIKFCEVYIQRAFMSAQQREDQKIARSRAFANIMRTPRIQLMFARQIPKEEIVKYVYDNYEHIIQAECGLRDVVKGNINKVKTVEGKLRNKARDVKREQQEEWLDFEVQSKKKTTMWCNTPIVVELREDNSMKEISREAASITRAFFLCTLLTVSAVFLKLFEAVSLTTNLLGSYIGLQNFMRGVESVPTSSLNGFLKAFSGSMETWNSDTSNRLIELKAIVHAIYELAYGDRKQVMVHLSYCLFTRPQIIVSAIKGLLSCINFKQTDIEITVGDDKYNLPVSVYVQYCATSEDKRSALIEPYKATFTPQNGVLKAIAHLFAKDVSAGSILQMDPQAIKTANDQWALLNHSMRNYDSNVEKYTIILRYIGKAIFGFDYEDPYSQKFMWNTMLATEGADNYAALTRKLSVDRELQSSVISHYQNMREIFKNPHFVMLPHFVQRNFEKRYEAMRTMSSEAQNFATGNTLRAEPAGVLLTGVPHTGKSAFMKFAVRSLKFLHKEKFQESDMYVYNPDSEYWEGYAQQFAVVIDDAFKEKDMETRMRVAAIWIMMINTVAFLLNMAFGQKGNNYFNSPYAFITTNLANNGIDEATFNIGLTDPQAFLRRCHVILHATEIFNPETTKVSEIVFRIDGCKYWPELVGSFINAVDAVKLIKNTRERNVECLKNMVWNDDELSALFSTQSGEEEGIRVKAEGVHTICTDPLNKSQKGAARLYNAKSIMNYQKDHLTKQQNSLRSWLLPKETKQCEMLVEEAEEDYKLWAEVNKDNPFHQPLEGRNPVEKEFITPDPDPKISMQRSKVPDIDPISYFGKFMKLYQEDFAYLGEYAKFLVVIFAGLLAYYYYSEIREFFGFSGQSKDYEKEWISRRIKAKRPNAPPTVAPHFSPQMAEGSRVRDFYINSLGATIQKGVVHMEAYNAETGKIHESCGFHYRDGYFFAPRHFMGRYKAQRDILHIHFGETLVEIPFPEYYDIDKHDLCVFYHNGQKPIGLSKYFAASTTLQFVEGQEMFMVSRSEQHFKIKPLHYASGPERACYYAIGSTFQVTKPMYYGEVTEAGESGSIVTRMGVQGRPEIVGMHLGIHHSTQKGTSMSFSKEWMDEIISNVKFTTQAVERQLPVEPLRFVQPGAEHMPPRNSKIRRSKMFGFAGEPVCVPARLKPFTNENGDVVDPLTLALKKMTQKKFPTPPYDKERLLKNFLHIYPIPDKPYRILTLDECLNGVSDLNINPIIMNTSAGYMREVPGCSTGKKGKSDYIDIIDDKKGAKPVLEKAVREAVDNMKKGVDPGFLFADTLKDETRPIEKVLEGKTRLFSAGQIHFNIIVKMYMGHWMADFQKYAHEKPIAVGINVHSRQWQLLYERLLERAKSVLSGDQSNYDGTATDMFDDLALLLWCIYYGFALDSEEANVMKILVQNFRCAKHIILNIVFQVALGNCSGQGATAFWNSLHLAFNILYILTEKLDLAIDDFRFTVYGDDSVITIDRPGITTDHLAHYFKTCFGMTYTHWTKKTFVGDDDLSKIRYLSRKFVEEEGVVKAPLELTTILESIYWYRKGTEQNQALVSTAQSMFIELSHHGEQVFNTVSLRLMDEVKKRVPELYEFILKYKRPYHDYFESMYVEGKQSIVMTYGCQDDFLKKLEIKRTSDFQKKLEQVEKEMKEGPPPTSSTSVIVKSNDYKLLENTIPVRINDETLAQMLGKENLDVESDWDDPIDFEIQSNVMPTDNSQFNDRAVNELAPTQTVELGTYDDATTLEATSIEQGENPVYKVNFETFKMDGIMDREYLIGSFPWTDAQATSTQLNAYNLPGAILSIAALKDKYKNFLYMKFNMRLSFRISATKTCGGSLIAAVNPMNNYGKQFVTPSDVKDLARYPHIIISAGGAQSATMDIPYMIQDRYFDMTSYPTSAMAGVRVCVLNPLVDAFGDTAQAEIIVTCQLLDAEVALPMNFTPQSRRIGWTPLKEANAKSTKNTISSTLNATANFAGTLKSVPVVGSYADVFSGVAKGAAGIAKAVGLDKPSSMARTQVSKINPFSDLTNGKGIDCGVKMGLDPENHISTTPDVGGVTRDEMSLVTLAGTPALVSQVTLYGTTTTAQFLCAFSDFDGGSDPSLYSIYGYDDFVRFNFEASSGSTQIKIYVFSTPFQSSRWVFWIQKNSATAKDWMQCYHKVVNFEGDSEFEMNCPYMNETVASTIDEFAQWSLWCQQLSWSEPDPVVALPLYMNIYRAAGGDSQFFGLLENQFIPQSNPRADFSAPFEPLHFSMKGYHTEGYIFGEEYKNVKDILHRPHAYYGVTNSASVLDVGPNYKGIEMWALCYKIWRGSIRPVFLTQDTTPKVAYVTNAVQPYVGMTASCSVNPLIQMEIPYYSRKLFQFTGTATDYGIVISGASVKFMMKSVGDDFSLMWITPFPKGNFDKIAAPAGLAGLSAWAG